jgi:hypothetical protein
MSSSSEGGLDANGLGIDANLLQPREDGCETIGDGLDGDINEAGLVQREDLLQRGVCARWMPCWAGSFNLPDGALKDTLPASGLALVVPDPASASEPAPEKAA